MRDRGDVRREGRGAEIGRVAAQCRRGRLPDDRLQRRQNALPIGLTNDAEAQPGVGRFETQTRRTFERMQMILQTAGGFLDDLVTMTVFVTDIRYGDEFVRLRGEILKREFPASALIGISQLAAPEALIEIQGVAVLE